MIGAPVFGEKPVKRRKGKKNKIVKILKEKKKVTSGQTCEKKEGKKGNRKFKIKIKKESEQWPMPLVSRNSWTLKKSSYTISLLFCFSLLARQDRAVRDVGNEFVSWERNLSAALLHGQ
jgi:hypothetical protein